MRACVRACVHARYLISSHIRKVTSLKKEKLNIPVGWLFAALTLAEEFCTYFCQSGCYIHKLEMHGNILPSLRNKKYETTLDCFKEATEEQIWAIIPGSPKKTCCLDPLPTWL